jgi:hypothetical protein
MYICIYIHINGHLECKRCVPPHSSSEALFHEALHVHTMIHSIYAYHTYHHTYRVANRQHTNMIEVFLCTYIPIFLCTYIPIFLCTYIPTFLCTYIPIFLCTYIPIFLCTYITVHNVLLMHNTVIHSIYAYHTYHHTYRVTNRQHTDWIRVFFAKNSAQTRDSHGLLEGQDVRLNLELLGNLLAANLFNLWCMYICMYVCVCVCIHICIYAHAL